ncbi:hypothetical protein SAMN05444162_0342 [Paenibacillaceae bacterium GAS479]|nr:hypothetical protein SAMN05444162_0342 [Paenibacillaceae bacterium GAS479]
MNNERAVVSNFNGSSMGVILVLFILLVIVVSVFCASSFNNIIDEVPSITASRNFRLINNSGSSVVLTSSRGDFEPPGPPSIVVISPSTYYSFEVLSVVAATRRAYASFGIVREQGVGVMETTLVSGRVGTSSEWIMDRFVSSVVTYRISGTTLTITDAAPLL